MREMSVAEQRYRAVLAVIPDGMERPLRRSSVNRPDSGPALDLSALAERRTGGPATTGSVAGWPATGRSRCPRSVQRRLAPQRRTGRRACDRPLEVWAGNDLTKA